jgi:hypothetical protein
MMTVDPMTKNDQDQVIEIPDFHSGRAGERAAKMHRQRCPA